jgi:octaprenyl-diphosphate synthase
MAVKIFSPQDFPAYLPKLNSLYDDLFAGGKGFRSKLVQIVSRPLKLSPETETLLCQTIEFIHNASLLHDDLIDRSQLRRGKPAAWTKYTPEYAVLAGDYLLARVMVNLSGHGNIKLVQYTSEIISDLLEGEWLQDSVVGDFFISVPQLDRIHNLKTASLFKWCLKAPFIALENYDKELHVILDEMGTLLGQLFQRSDDLLDYDIRNDEGKAILGDLKSGYLNSFGAFVASDMSRPEIDKMVKSKDLNDFYTIFDTDVVSGREIFLYKVNQFDAINVDKIKLYHHYVQQLQLKLGALKIDESSTQQLITILNSLTDLLYFRKKSS